MRLVLTVNTHCCVSIWLNMHSVRSLMLLGALAVAAAAKRVIWEETMKYVHQWHTSRYSNFSTEREGECWKGGHCLKHETKTFLLDSVCSYVHMLKTPSSHSVAAYTSAQNNVILYWYKLVVMQFIDSSHRNYVVLANNVDFTKLFSHRVASTCFIGGSGLQSDLVLVIQCCNGYRMWLSTDIHNHMHHRTYLDVFSIIVDIISTSRWLSEGQRGKRSVRLCLSFNFIDQTAVVASVPQNWKHVRIESRIC